VGTFLGSLPRQDRGSGKTLDQQGTATHGQTLDLCAISMSWGHVLGQGEPHRCSLSHPCCSPGSDSIRFGTIQYHSQSVHGRFGCRGIDKDGKQILLSVSFFIHPLSGQTVRITCKVYEQRSIPKNYLVDHTFKKYEFPSVVDSQCQASPFHQSLLS